MTAVQSLRPTARPLASEKKFCMAVKHDCTCPGGESKRKRSGRATVRISWCNPRGRPPILTKTCLLPCYRTLPASSRASLCTLVPCEPSHIDR